MIIRRHQVGTLLIDLSNARKRSDQEGLRAHVPGDGRGDQGSDQRLEFAAVLVFSRHGLSQLSLQNGTKARRSLRSASRIAASSRLESRADGRPLIAAVAILLVAHYSPARFSRTVTGQKKSRLTS